EYLGRHWASHGYVCVHLQHLGSDSGIWLGKGNIQAELMKAASDPKNAADRLQDVRFAIDELTKLNAWDLPLKGKLDMDKLGMAGHSFGAYTTMAVIGQIFVTSAGREISSAEPRIRAAISMSPQAPKNRDTFDKSYGSITVPTLHLTGTKDTSPVDPAIKA